MVIPGYYVLGPISVVVLIISVRCDHTVLTKVTDEILKRGNFTTTVRQVVNKPQLGLIIQTKRDCT